MHASSLENMQKCYERYVCGEYFQSKKTLTVLDVGGANVNGSYADIFSQEKIKYIAADISENDGVDVVLDSPYELPFDNNSIDILISGQVFEHVEFFWLLFEEMVRVLKEDGWIFLIAPSSGGIHRFPVDCYRFYPDSYYALAKYTHTHAIHVFRDERGPWQDLVGVFSKTRKEVQPDFSRWQVLAKNEINNFLLERLPASINIERQSDAVEKIQGKVSYLQILKILHEKIKPSNYIEIGIRKGKSLALAECPSIAIDPMPDIDKSQFNQISLYQMSSDHFFEHHSKVLGQKFIDLAFIDGMHLFEFVLRDFINIEAHSCDSTVVVIDDIFPNHTQQASRKRTTQVWTGDVWKMVVCLKEHRPDLNIITLDCNPTGLMIITGLKKNNKVLVNKYNPLVRKFNQFSIENYQHLIVERADAIDPEGIRIKRFLDVCSEQKTNNRADLNAQVINLKPKLSIVINFYNMRREAKRTLYSLTTKYQRDVNVTDYEVIAVDSGSTEKLDPEWVKSLGENFRYIYFDAQNSSPCAAINYAVKQAGGDKVMCCIDGARILSPSILKHTLSAFKLHKNPFIYTLGMHLGDKLQNISIEEGYTQEVEDTLLSSVDWKHNGYELFRISTLAGSSRKGYFSPISESNCFAMTKESFFALGGFDEKFTSAGGGLVNLDIFNQANERDSLLQPILLLGEATFHQIHGGVATNVPLDKHPMPRMRKEYAKIRGREFKSVYQLPAFYGVLVEDYHKNLAFVR